MEKNKVTLYPRLLQREDAPISYDLDDWVPVEAPEEEEDSGEGDHEGTDAEKLEKLRIDEIKKIRERHSLHQT